MDREVRYRVLDEKFRASDQFLNPGRHLEVSINWPAQLDIKVALKWLARGRVVRANQNGAAVQIHQYEFRRQAPQGSAGRRPAYI